MLPAKKIWPLVFVSLLIGFLGWIVPGLQSPLNYAAMLRLSIPCAIAWALVVTFALVRFRTRGLWLLIGAPMALYWPVWMLFNHFPPCYYRHGCM